MHDVDVTVHLRHDRLAFRHAGFEDFLHARQTPRDVIGAIGATGVERPHRQLGRRLADRLRGNDSHRGAKFNVLVAGQVVAIAALADTALRPALHHRAHGDRRHLALAEQIPFRQSDDFAGPDQDFAGFRIDHIGHQHPAKSSTGN